MKSDSSPKPSIAFSDFQKLDLRVGKVIDATNIVQSRKLIELTVDLGEEHGVQTVFTGMRTWYTPQDYIGKQFLFVVNLEPKKMMGKECGSMMLAADEDGTPLLLEISSTIPLGLPVW
ncbi:methionine--tRNA ligase [Candidatus Woesebacteria bacterium]|nr:methionine--tRNA ligase [Candidatus Woesebacteria bacterium]